MMNRTAMRLAASLAMLSPGDLIDALLGRLDRFRDALVPVQAETPACAKVPVQTPRDRLTA